jgi:hypothetical protein
MGEIKRLTAVSEHLQTMAFTASDGFSQSKVNGEAQLEKWMNPKVQSNLDQILKEQMEQIQEMNRSSRRMSGFQKSIVKPPEVV